MLVLTKVYTIERFHMINSLVNNLRKTEHLDRLNSVELSMFQQVYKYVFHPTIIMIILCFLLTLNCLVNKFSSSCAIL